MPEPDVRLDRVSKRFGDTTAVDDVSLTIDRGEFFTMLGPSGCGKTTTLRMIGGFEAPSAGAIHLGDVDVTELPPFKRDVNTVFQNYALFPHLNVFENVAFGLRRRRVAVDEIRRRVGETLDLVELPGYEQRKPSQLSGGQQQRVALARALINRPRVLLLDEPLGALDQKLRKQMQVELKRIQGEVGITFIFVTHDQDEAMTMSDRIAVMRDGRIEQLGTPEELYERPHSDFVANFLGVSNLLDGEVVGAAAGLAEIRLADGTVVRAPFDAANGWRSVRVGVRPEKLRVTPTAVTPGAAVNAVLGNVLDASYLGVSTQYLVETGNGHQMTVYAQNLDTSGSTEVIADGEAVCLSWQPKHTFVIERQPGSGQQPTSMEEDGNA